MLNPQIQGRSPAQPSRRQRSALFSPLLRGGDRLGQILVDRGVIDRNSLRHALALKMRSGARLGEVLRAHALASDADIADGLAAQWSLPLVDLKRWPPEPDLLITPDAAACLGLGTIPWRRIGNRTVLLVADPGDAEDAIRAAGLQDQHVAIAMAPLAEIRAALERYFAPELEESARLASPPDLNCRNWPQARIASVVAGSLFAAACLAFAAPSAFFWVFFAVALTANVATMSLRLLALAARFWPERRQRSKTPPHQLPIVSLLVPLHREDRVIPQLLENLDLLDYPRELLDIKLLLEDGDDITADAIAGLDYPRPFDVITVPPNDLRTKPRALNYGLNFCRGEIVGILDAEDRPEPGQIRAVIETLHRAPSHVACVQARLDFYNPKRNWLSRCFTVEYAVWFNVLLRGFRRLGLPIPLGGTSVYFRRGHLERLCGWDAHNVTEDADLGFRLARFGYTAEYCPSVTYEEANCEVLPWIRQRSRWLKGYMMTWGVHAARPRRLFRDLGLPGFLAFHITLLGGVVSYLTIPVFWFLWIGALGVDLKQAFGGASWLWEAAFASMLIGQVVMLATGIAAVARPGRFWLIPWLPTMFFYWPIGAAAALKAAIEMVVAPYYWDKTVHGSYSDQGPADLATDSQTSPKPDIATPNLPAASNA